ncbi:hypothetical protein K466DRAFT_581975 [Polyporus arcularius HHB13444]|uniref:DUF7918 domain-containing protein n=1 Tax=Polyporus arcularius HHB13444 TaxID=1314778 RepID=A0A5C3PUL2_9APHY|nr:hypothetical protein K466DRAFT_581975 [Polyporus arcularius HHB13444]
MRTGSCEVWLTCEGQRLPEYCVETSKEGTITCFVPSEAGKEFEVYGQNDYDEILALSIAFDGSPATALPVDPGKRASSSSLLTSPTSRQRFQFSEIVTTDEEDALERHDAARLGSIEVEGFRMRWDKTQETPAPKTFAFQPTGRVHERSKKAGTHCIALGAPITVGPVPLGRRWGVAWLDKSPIVIFRFHYRPLALLQAQEIAPLSQPNALQSQPGASEPDADQLAASQSQSQPQGGASQSEPGPSRQRADRGSADLQTEGSRPAKRARIGSEDADTKPDVETPSEDDDEDELSTLRSSASALQGHLQQLMSKIDRMESKKTRKKARPRGVAKREDPAGVGFVSGEVVDLTLSD